MSDISEPIPVGSQQNATPVVCLQGIWKIFDGVAVLRGVSLDLKPGEIHTLLGGNGSGKSTLMKILSGIYAPDAGSIELEGNPVVLRGPAQGHELRIYMVPQEPQIFPHLSVEENLLMGTNLQPSTARERIKLFAQELGFAAGLSEAAGSLSIANQQLLEIIRGLLHSVKVLILDEPTSSLTFREVDSLFEILRKLAARGIGIFYISHRLNEILEIADRVSVLRDGNLVLSQPADALTSRDLIRAMLPESSQEAASSGSANKNGHSQKSGEPAQVVLEVKNLEGEMFHNVSFSVRAGEVVGLAGVVGAGRTELAQAILGIDPNVKGEVWIYGKQALDRSPGICQDLGLAYVPEDRHLHGIFLELPNMLTTSAGVLCRLGKLFISEQKEQELAGQYVKKLQIKVNSLDQLARTLSGGNQQKVVLSKVLAGDPRVIMLDEPTRGVDAKARQDVYYLIRQLTDQGVGVVLISSDLEEVTLLSDRVLVMFHGVVLEELAHSDCQIERITSAAFGIPG
jgi:AI-2 transport system ATP-binding protein